MKRNARTEKKNQGKILELPELAAKIRELKAAGKRVIHCHGVFDLLHVGHIRHFREAKAMGDVLVVTLTPDRYVNKGPHRPAFPERLRLEAVASLEMVDYAALNRWPQAVRTIKTLRPHAYVKGPDFRVASEDVTGGITLEEKAVRSVGGEMRFTTADTFSSSNLLNRHMPLFEPAIGRYLQRFRARRSIPEIYRQLDRLKKLRVLVVGEAILDEYVYCGALGKSSKEPILAMLYSSKEVHAGGAVIVSNHAASFCRKATLLTYLGERDRREGLIRRSLLSNVTPRFITKSDSPTVLKSRITESYLLAKKLEIYRMNDEPLRDKEEKVFLRMLERELPRHDLVIVADYGHGLIGPKAAKLLCGKARFLAVNTQINAANIGFHAISKYRRADFVCIQEGELRLENRSRRGDLAPMMRALAKRMRCRSVMVTRGRNGILIHDAKRGFCECPAFAIKVVDRVGAGDAVLSLASMCAAARVPPDITAFVGNLAGAQAVLITGNSASLDPVALYKSVESLLK